MPKLPQHIEKRFDEEFDHIVPKILMEGKKALKEIKSFIATILNEEREKIAKMVRDEVIKYVQEAVKNPESDNYIYAENIPLSRLDDIINLIKEDK